MCATMTSPRRAARHREGPETDWLTFNGNFTITRANFDNGDTVPLSPRTTAYADLTARFPWGLSASLDANYVGPRFLTEDRSVSGDGYTLLNFVARYRDKFLEAFVNLNNLLNQKYQEVQFFYTSRLRGEPVEGVADIHFTPGAPFSVFGAWPSASDPVRGIRVGRARRGARPRCKGTGSAPRATPRGTGHRAPPPRRGNGP
jgi:hypothetical protein